MTRNANGEGSIYRWNKNGKPAGYKGAISYKDETGTTKRYVAYGRTRQDVRAKLDAARERLTAGAPVKDAKRTVGDWLAHWRATGGIRPQRVDTRPVCNSEPLPRAATIRRHPPGPVEAQRH